MKKERIWIETAVRKKQPFKFISDILGFNFFKINEWEQKIFEAQYIKGSREQDIQTVLDTAIKEIFLQYGKENVVVKAVFDTWNGEKIKVI